MSWTKQQLVEQAFEEIGLAAYVYDLTPEQLQSACRRMDAMVAEWESSGIRIGYPLSASPNSTNINDDSNVPTSCVSAIYLNLAVRLAPSFGKNLSPATTMLAAKAFSSMCDTISTQPIEMQMPSTMPRGAGHKPWRNTNSPFMPKPEDTIDAGPDGPIDFI